MNGKVLSQDVNRYTASIALMDKFESVDQKGQRIYDILEMPELFNLFYDNTLYRITLYIKRRPYNINYIENNFTFTDLKNKLARQFIYESNKENIRVVASIIEYMKAHKTLFEDNGNVMFEYETPIEFKAQISSNRCGYGDIYHYGELVHEGTKYGDTTGYMFVGAKCVRW